MKPLGRKPLADQSNKKAMLRLFIEQRIIDANGGEQSCKDKCTTFLKDNQAVKKPAKVIEPKTQNYQTCLDIYFTFIKQRTSVAPKMSGGEGKALKELIAYFDSIVIDKEDPQAVPKAFQYLFDNWQRIEPFLQGQLKLMQINSNITNILNQIRNGKPSAKESTDQRIERIYKEAGINP